MSSLLPRRFPAIAGGLFCLAMLISGVGGGSATLAGTLAPDLDQALRSAGADDLIPIVVMMEAFPARGQLLQEVEGMNRANRRAHVVSTLKSLAERSQRSVRDALVEHSGQVQDLRVLWGINALALKATPAVIERVASLSPVRRVQLDNGRGRPADGMPATGPTGGDTSGPNPEATVRGEVISMGAQQVWQQLGYTGAGVIVAVIDTGVYRDHPDLADHIWTNLDEIPENGLDDDNNGYVDDTWGWDLCNDDNMPTDGSHGTQVAGQVAGDGTNGTMTGMAPDAELMVLGIQCSPPDSIGWLASDYAIENGAHIITESYIWPWTEDTPDFEGWRRQTDTQLAAGVIHVNAAGNDGQDLEMELPYNVSAPANSPPPWLHPDQTLVGGISSTISVANIEWSTNSIAPSSSRGPSAWEDIVTYTDPTYPHTLTPEYMDYPYHNGTQMGLLKPDIAAYGNGTYTTCPGTGYCSFSGTSSATPHVAGVLALMLQANPEATPAELTEALLTHAQHRGDPGKNNVYGTGLVQAYPAVVAVESGVVYQSHVIDDSLLGNDDGRIDPGEQLSMQITVESRTDADIDGLEAILSTPTPGVTIHNQHADFPTLLARETASSLAPHFSLAIDPATCTQVITFDLEMRYQGKVRRSSFVVRVGDEYNEPLIDDSFETDLGWTADPGGATDGFWVREDPVGVRDSSNRLTNPEDDTSDPGNTCWVTGNGGGGQDDDDVDGGPTTLTSPTFGYSHMLSLNLTYDRWFYDNQSSANNMKVEISNNGGADWTLVEQVVYGYGGWTNKSYDLFSLITPSAQMLLRFAVDDGGSDGTLEGGVDEVLITGLWVECEDFTPPATLAPNPVGASLRLAKHSGGHAILTWQAPPVDGGHDAATLYRIERAESPDGPFIEVGTATATEWVGVDAFSTASPFFYRVIAENAGGSS